MKANHPVSLAVALIFALLAGCSGGLDTTPPPSSSNAVSLTIRDAPPAGVTVLSFQINVTGATLNPGTVDLLVGRSPIKIEVKRLEVETAFLSNANVAANSYTSLSLAFANPEMTFKNDSGATLTAFGVTCLNGAVCEIRPTGMLTATVNFPAPGLTISGTSPTGLMVDLRLDRIISSALAVDFSAAGNVGITQLPLPGLPTGQLEEIEDLFGKVANRGTDTFDLQMGPGTIAGIKADSATQLAGFTCTPLTFANCVQNGQLVEVDLKLMAGGILLAKKIEQENEEVNEEDLEGIVFSINPATSTFRMVLVENASSLTGLPVGRPVDVFVRVGARFGVSQDGLNLSPALLNSFRLITDMLVGQNVQVRRRSGDGSSASPIETDRVRLRMSRFTARVRTRTPPNSFTVDNLPPMFGSAIPAITEIIVNTFPETRFDGVSGVAGLSIPPNADRVSLRGLLFKQVPLPVLAAKKVRKQP